MTTATFHRPSGTFCPRQALAPEVSHHEQWLPTRPLGDAGRRVGHWKPPTLVTCDAGIPIPSYEARRDRYTAAEWSSLQAVFLPQGAIINADGKRWAAIAGQTPENTNAESFRHFTQIASYLGARVRRHLNRPGAAGDRTQERLREVLQAEYLPAKARLDQVAHAVGGAHQVHGVDALRLHFGDLREALPFLEERLCDSAHSRHPVHGLVRQRRNRHVGRDVAEVLHDHFSTGGTSEPATLTRAIRRELGPEGVQFHHCRSGYYFLHHSLMHRSEGLSTCVETGLQFVVRAGRPTENTYPSVTDLLGLREEVAQTLAWHHGRQS